VECQANTDCHDAAKPTCDQATFSCKAGGAGGGAGGGSGGGTGGGSGGGDGGTGTKCVAPQALTLGTLADGGTGVSMTVDTTGAGPSVLTVTTAPPSVKPPNDTCSTPVTLVFDGGTATATVDTTVATDDYKGTCGGNGNDAVFHFTTTAPQDITLNVSSANAD